MVDIEVYTKKKDKVRQPAAEWLPSTPFLMGVSGPSMSGKGVLVQNTIMNLTYTSTPKETVVGVRSISGLAVQT